MGECGMYAYSRRHGAGRCALEPLHFGDCLSNAQLAAMDAITTTPEPTAHTTPDECRMSERTARVSEPAVNDEYAAANYAYTEAAWAYEDALQRRVSPEEQATAREGLRAAANRLHRAMTARVAARQDAPTFAHLLADPMQQLDPNGEVLASIVAYQNATTATASTTNPTARQGSDTEEA